MHVRHHGKKRPQPSGGVNQRLKRASAGKALTRRLSSLRDSPISGNPQKKKHTIPSAAALDQILDPKGQTFAEQWRIYRNAAAFIVTGRRSRDSSRYFC